MDAFKSQLTLKNEIDFSKQSTNSISWWIYIECENSSYKILPVRSFLEKNIDKHSSRLLRSNEHDLMVFDEKKSGFFIVPKSYFGILKKWESLEVNATVKFVKITDWNFDYSETTWDFAFTRVSQWFQIPYIKSLVIESGTHSTEDNSGYKAKEVKNKVERYLLRAFN